MRRISNVLILVLAVAAVGLLVLLFQAVVSGGLGMPLAQATRQPGYPPPEATVSSPTPLPIIQPSTWTVPPVSTPLPTPFVTRFPTSRPTIVSKTTQDYIVIFQEEGALRAFNSNHDNGVRPASRLLPLGSIVPAGRADHVRPWGWGRLSPDGKELALVSSGYDIHLVDLATNNVRLLVEQGVEPVWSPDGTQIAYRDFDTWSLSIIRADTGEARELFRPQGTGYPGVDFLTWSPDGQRIAFVKPSDLESGSLWINDVNGESNPIQLVSEDWLVGSVRWSPTGDQILFVSEAGDYITSSRPLNLWVVDATTGKLQQLTQNMSVSGGTPDWSPDGEWIVFTATNVLEGGDLPYDLWIISRDGDKLIRLTDDPESDLYPAWPEEQRIVFQKVGAGMWEYDFEAGILNQLYERDSDYVIVR